jgi:hypothetical protein
MTDTSTEGELMLDNAATASQNRTLLDCLVTREAVYLNIINPLTAERDRYKALFDKANERVAETDHQFLLLVADNFALQARVNELEVTHTDKADAWNEMAKKNEIIATTRNDALEEALHPRRCHDRYTRIFNSLGAVWIRKRHPRS